MSTTVAALLTHLYDIGSWLTPVALLLRPLFFLLDGVIYSFIPIVYSFALTLVNIPLVANQNQIFHAVASSIYSLLAVAMLFRLAFSLLTMLADPDKIEDKEVGASKLFTNVIVVMILIVAIPFLFGYAMDMQDVLIGIKRDPATGQITEQTTGVIEKIFLRGADNQCIKKVGGQCIDLGTYISRTVFQIFIYPTPGTMIEGQMTDLYNTIFYGPNWTIFGLTTYITATTLQGVPILGITIPLIPTFAYSYLFLISTIVGGYLLWIFITFALDIAYRSVKLFALQLISPIAIVSYIDPKSASKGIFKKWTEEVLKTYLSLFIRIATISIVGLILMSIDWHANAYDAGITDPSQQLQNVFGSYNPFVKLFFFLGILTFLKTAPKMFEEIFGYKGKTKEEGFGASMLRGALGGLTAGAVGAISGGISAKSHGEEFWKGAGLGGWQGLKGGASSAYGGKLGGYGKALTGGPGATGKALGYKTGVEAYKQKFEDAKARSLDKEFKDIRNQNDYLIFGKDEGEQAYLDYLNTQGAAGVAERNAYNATPDADKMKRRADYARDVAFLNNTNLNATDRAVYTSLKKKADKDKFRSDFGKKIAINATTKNKDIEAANALIDKINKDWKVRMGENRVVDANDLVTQKSTTYNAILTAKGGNQADVDVMRALAELNTAKSDRDNATADLEYDKTKSSDAEKHITALSEDSAHAPAFKEIKMRDRGNQLNS